MFGQLHIAICYKQVIIINILYCILAKTNRDKFVSCSIFAYQESTSISIHVIFSLYQCMHYAELGCRSNAAIVLFDLDVGRFPTDIDSAAARKSSTSAFQRK